MFADQAVGYAAPAARPSAIETGTKLYISNLDYGVSNEDIKVWFLFHVGLVFGAELCTFNMYFFFGWFVDCKFLTSILFWFGGIGVLLSIPILIWSIGEELSCQYPAKSSRQGEDTELGSVVYPNRLCSSKLDDSNADDLVLVKKGAIFANIVLRMWNEWNMKFLFWLTLRRPVLEI